MNPALLGVSWPAPGLVRVAPATTSGTPLFGPDGRYSTTGDVVYFPPTINSLPVLRDEAGTILFAFTNDWASTEETEHRIVTVRATTAVDSIRLRWTAGSNTPQAHFYGGGSEYCGNLNPTFAAKTRHVWCCRWGDAGQGAKIDLSFDGEHSTQIAKAQTLTVNATEGIRVLGGGSTIPPVGYIGFALFSAYRMSDACHDLAVAAAQARDVRGLVRCMRRGDLLVPFRQHSNGYQMAMDRAEIPDQGLIVFDGNSIMNGSNNTAGQEPYALTMANFPSLTYAEYAAGGLTTQQMTADAVAQIDSQYRNDKVCAIVVAQEIHNDLIANELDAATAYGNYVTYCQARQAAGWKVVATTCLTSGSDPAGGEVAAINTSMRGNWEDFADVLCDLQADPRLDDHTDTDYFLGDGIHLNDAGSAAEAELLTTAIESLL